MQEEKIINVPVESNDKPNKIKTKKSTLKHSHSQPFDLNQFLSNSQKALQNGRVSNVNNLLFSVNIQKDDGSFANNQFITFESLADKDPNTLV